MRAGKYVILIVQTLVSGILAAFVGLVGVTLVCRQLGIPMLFIKIGPFSIWGDWPILLFTFLLCILAMVTSFRYYHKSAIADVQKSEDEDKSAPPELPE